MEQPGHEDIVVQCFVFSIPAQLCSLQHLPQLREDVCRTENQEDGECEMKSRDRVESSVQDRWSVHSGDWGMETALRLEAWSKNKSFEGEMEMEMMEREKEWGEGPDGFVE